ncbi:Exportin-2 [Trichoplax sp. H2]|nr:Exportin-2 [Trichoplax sp. H2]|eukprot:RDD37617.1 Exportin-2 [Trichoplax sp. H2]
MEVNDETLRRLAQCLRQTLDPSASVRRPAEQSLEQLESNAGYSLLLLRLVDNNQLEMEVRIAATIAFKNFIKKNWRIIEDEPSKINDNDRQTVKSLIVNLMLSSPEMIQRQLSDTISIIGREDFPGNWLGLMPEILEKIKSNNLNVINGILRTAHSLFKRYRHEFKSNELFAEIKYVLDSFAEPLTVLFQASMETVRGNVDDPTILQPVFESLTLMCKIFYSLNYQDIPEFFEDNMKTWMDSFLFLLTTSFPKLQTKSDDIAGPIEIVRSQICDSVTLYAQKYDEEFQSYLPAFVTAVWTLLTNTGMLAKYDLLVSNAIQFLTSVCERENYKGLFHEESVLRSICEKVVIPNMQFRDIDEENFEFNPEEYIRKDIEGSDVDTRRRAASDLIRGLCKHFEVQVTNICSAYVNVMLQEYIQNPSKNWKCKDSAIHLVTSLANRTQTARHGSTAVNELVNIVDFFTSQVMPELASTDESKSVLKADSIKFIITFRGMLPPKYVIDCIPILVTHLLNESIVVHSYAAFCIERIFMIKNASGGDLITVNDVQSILQQLITNLFGTLSISGSEENDYVMKAIMRAISLAKASIIPLVPRILPLLTEKLRVVSKNPRRPQFNHYLFETICCIIRYTCKEQIDTIGSFEGSLLPVFQEILQQDVLEFLPYVFQVLSLLLELRQPPTPDMYLGLFSCLLNPVLWERQGNIPALVRLLQAYVMKSPAKIATAENSLNGVLGVFQKLIASKSNDHHGFYLLQSILEFMPKDVVDRYMHQVYLLLFQRLQKSKTTKFVKGFIVFCCLCLTKGVDSLIELVDSIQPKLFGMVIERLFLLDLQKVDGVIERKICAVGISKLLTESSKTLSEDQYLSYWPNLLQALINFFEIPSDDTLPDDEHFIDVEDTPGYQVAFSQLIFAGKNDYNPVSDIGNPKQFLAIALSRLSNNHPGKIIQLINQMNAEAQKFLNNYLQASGVTIS